MVLGIVAFICLGLTALAATNRKKKILYSTGALVALVVTILFFLAR